MSMNNYLASLLINCQILKYSTLRHKRQDLNDYTVKQKHFI